MLSGRLLGNKLTSGLVEFSNCSLHAGPMKELAVLRVNSHRISKWCLPAHRIQRKPLNIKQAAAGSEVGEQC